MWEKRRLNPRVEIELPANYRVNADDPPQEARIANLSAGGAAIRTERQIPPNSLLHEFTFSLSNGARSSETLEASAMLVHARPYSDDGSISYFSGLRFLGFEDREFERLESFVRNRIARDRQTPQTDDRR